MKIYVGEFHIHGGKGKYSFSNKLTVIFAKYNINGKDVGYLTNGCFSINF